MSDEAARDRLLLAIAGAVAEGHDIPWDDERERAFGEDVSLIGALQSLERIAVAQRRLLELPSARVTHWGHLKIIEQLHSASQSAYYRARVAGMTQEVLLLLAGPLQGDPSTVARLLKDARRQTQLEHPHVANVHGADYTQDHVGLWMEALPGQTLEQWVTSRGPLDVSEASAIARDLSSAVAAFHRAGLVHGAVHPANVFRRDDGRVVLAASLCAGAPSASASSPQPEASDIVGLGLTLQFLLSGAYPGPAAVDACDAPITRGLPRRFARIVARTLSVDSAIRLSNTVGFEAALKKANRSARVSWQWIVGFGVAVVLAATVVWLTAGSTTP